MKFNHKSSQLCEAKNEAKILIVSSRVFSVMSVYLNNALS